MKKSKVNFIFFGTPDVASNTLRILKQNGLLPEVIVTSLDKPRGRKMVVTPSPVKVWAIENGIPYLQPEKIDGAFISELKKYDVDLFLVVAYGKILPEELINLPKKGTINIHYSLLPKYRGASPVESALLNGDTATGVSIQKMVYKLDSGPIIARKNVEINPDDNKETLRGNLIKTGAELLLESLPDFLEDKIKLEEQKEEEATFCCKIKKEDGEIKLGDNDLKNYNKYRAFYGWPGVFFFKDINGKKIRYKITKARLENNIFIIEKVIPEGKKETDYKQ